MSQETIKIKLDKVNSLFNVFLKEGMENTSKLERDLLKIQLNSLISELDKFDVSIIAEETIILTPSINKESEKIIETQETPIITIEKEITQDELVKEELPKVNEEEKVIEIAEEVIVEKNEAPIIEPKAETLTSTPIIQFISDEKDEDEETAITYDETKEFTTNKPTRSLKEVIDLNKSFVLRAELFSNNNDEYKAFIDELNIFESEKNSFQFVEQTASKKGWNKEDKVYELLLRAVEKRFLPLI